MSYYFDTSSIRKISNKLHEYADHDIYTSSLAIFELISGMTEKEYEKRKSIIKNVINSNIEICWDTYKKRMHSAWKIEFVDIESSAIKKMAKIIIESNSFEDIDKICIENNEWFRLESFSGLDDEISEAGKIESEEGIKNWINEYDKDKRKNINEELFDNNLIYTYVNGLVSIVKRKFVEELVNVDSHNDFEKYYETMQNYDGTLDVYFWCTQLQFSLSQLKGMQYGKNDTADILHTIFVKKGDVIVSDDNIFKRLNTFSNYFDCINSKEFLERIN